VLRREGTLLEAQDRSPPAKRGTATSFTWPFTQRWGGVPATEQEETNEQIILNLWIVSLPLPVSSALHAWI